MSNAAELRDVLGAARRRPEARTILFIDELHRFNKTQQDLLLPDVEQGVVRLIGATTHNPGFYVNPPLLSRSHLFRLEPLSTEGHHRVLTSPLQTRSAGLAAFFFGVTATPECFPIWRSLRWGPQEGPERARGDRLGQGRPLPIVAEDLAVFARERRIRYDADEDEHYDTISAYIKSCRGGDPDAAIYWLAKMLAGGRTRGSLPAGWSSWRARMSALQTPHALPLAVAAHHAVDLWDCGASSRLPRRRSNRHSPKSNSATLALGRRVACLPRPPVQKVPAHLRDKGGQASKRMGHGEGYATHTTFPSQCPARTSWKRPLGLYSAENGWRGGGDC